MTHEERLALAMEFNKKFIASNYVSRNDAREIIEAGKLSQEEIYSLAYLYVEWKPDTSYKVGEYLRYDSNLFKVIQAHTSQLEWQPVLTPSLYTLVQAQGVIEEWGSRNLTTNPFMIGEQVKYEGLIYESIIDNNTWSPTDYPQGWLVIE